MSYTRSYQLQHVTNLGKINQIRELLLPYQKALQILLDHNMRQLTRGSLTKPKWLTASERHELLPHSVLSQRQIQSVSNHANQIYAAYLTSIENKVRSFITNSMLPDEMKKNLYKNNKAHAWYQSEHKLSRYLAKQARKVVKYPNLKRTSTMHLDGTVADVQRNRTTDYDYWLRISTLTRNKSVYVPLKANNYFNSKKGNLANFVQVKISPNAIKFSLVKHYEDSILRTNGSILALDWGMVSLFTDSNGKRYGVQLFEWLKEIDSQLESLTKQLQQQHIQLKTNKRYQGFQSRIREHVKNEVNRILNKIAATGVNTLVVEKLDFRHGGLSKRLNRLLTRFGRAAVNSKFISLRQEQGIVVEEVNPAYTSQQCSGCGYIDKKNRFSQDRF